MTKTCAICGEDCSDRPRVQDRRGRYYCKACSLQAVRVQHAGSAQPTDRAPEAFELAPDEAEPECLHCPVCNHRSAPGARTCAFCGYDPEQGPMSSRLYRRSLAKGKSGEKRCRECGYDLYGLRDPICPECGTAVSLFPKDELHQELERDIARAEWIKPAVWLGVGFVGSMIAVGITSGPAGLIGYPVLLAIEIAIGYAVLWTCFTFLGDLGTPLLNLLRLAGIYALVDLVSVVAGLIPLVIFSWLIALACYIGLFADAFDTDWTDAAIVIVLTGCVKIAMAVALIYFGMRLF